MQLEKNISQLLDILPLFYKKLHPNRAHNGKYIEGEPFDFIVIKKSEVYCFDTKECSSDCLYFKNIPLHQFNDLLKAEKQGAIVFFLIYFTKYRKLLFIHPRTIIETNKATPSSIEIESDLKNIIKSYLS